MSVPVRVLALWSPDWPVTAAARAAGVPPHRPAAVVVANRVLACSAVARAQGVRRGLRRREAQARCPDLVVLARDADWDARAFEPVVLAVEELAPGVEIVRPGLLALPAKGPVGFFGGEQAAAERLVDEVAARAGVECQVGVADGLFAAVLAARRGLAVGAGDTRAFLAPLGVEELDRDPDVDRSALVDLLRRLGLRSLGAFASLDADDVASRFGADAVLGHRLARGLDPRPPVRRAPPEELAVERELDPPVDRVDAAAFAARGLAERLHAVLAGHGLSCTRLGIAARTTDGPELHRIWRCAEPLTPSGTVDRVRWQLDAWLARGGAGAVGWLRLVPEETVTAGALQLGLWGEVGEADERAGRAMVRVQALLGPDAVGTAVLVGGRDPHERVRLVPWGDERPPGEDAVAGRVETEESGADEVVVGGGSGAGGIGGDGSRAGGSGAGGPGGSRPGAGGSVSGGSEVGFAGDRSAGGVGGAAGSGHDRRSGAKSTGSGRECAEAAIMVPTGVPGVGAPPGDGSGRDGSGSEAGFGGDRPGGGTGGAAGSGHDRRSGAKSAGSGRECAEAAIMAPFGGSGTGEPADGSGDRRRPEESDPRAGVRNAPTGERTGPGKRAEGVLADLIGVEPARDGAAPAGWPDDVLRVTGRVSAAQPPAVPPGARRRPPGAGPGGPRSRPPGDPAPAWPGRLPAPSPASVPPDPSPAELLDATGGPVRLAAPDRLTAPPHRLAVDGGPARAVEGWAGPWPVQQRWWAGGGAAGRLQVALDDGTALLLVARDGRWWVTGIYD